MRFFRFSGRGFLKMAAVLPLAGLIGCESCIRESRRYADGTPAYQQTFLAVKGGGRIPHGFYKTWYPGGTRRNLDFFVRGRRHGYSFRWNEAGDLIRLEHCVHGACEERPLPSSPPRAASVLALSGS